MTVCLSNLSASEKPAEIHTQENNLNSINMGAFVTYSNLITYILPIFCSAICSVFTLLLIWNYRNLAERKLRRVVSIYCILIAVWWSSVLWHVLSDDPIFLPVDIPLPCRIFIFPYCFTISFITWPI